MKLKSFAGLALVALAVAVTLAAKGYQETPALVVRMYIVSIVLFGVGGLLALDMSLKFLLGIEDKPVFDQEMRTVKVPLNCQRFYMNNGKMNVEVETYNVEGKPAVEIHDLGNGWGRSCDGVQVNHVQLLAGDLSVNLVNGEFVIGWKEGQDWQLGVADKSGPV